MLWILLVTVLALVVGGVYVSLYYPPLNVGLQWLRFNYKEGERWMIRRVTDEFVVLTRESKTYEFYVKRMTIPTGGTYTGAIKENLCPRGSFQLIWVEETVLFGNFSKRKRLVPANYQPPPPPAEIPTIAPPWD